MKALIHQRRKQNDEGFTLIELLLVIIILGILAAVVVFSVRGVSDRGQSSACRTSKATTIAAIEAYYARNGLYPADLTTLKTDGFVADLPNQAGNTVNGPAKGASFEWSLTYTVTGGGAQYTFAPTIQPTGGC